MSLWYLLALIRLQNFFTGIEIKRKQKLKFIVYFEQILECVLVFLLLTLKR